MVRIGKRKDGRFYPKNHSNGSMSAETFTELQAQNKTRTRMISKEERARLQTLENPMLYKKVVTMLEELNPDRDIESLIDKTLEPTEAIFDLKKKHPEIDIGLRHKDNVPSQFREFLDEHGIENKKVQDLVAKANPPLSEQELAQLSYLLNARPERDQKLDKAKKAPYARTIRGWMEHPNRKDIPTVDG